jgi:Phosphoribosylformylglycinamidine (FGAM) synthase, synthetase domain
MVGMVGLIDDIKKVTTSDFKQSQDLIYVLGQTDSDFNGSEIQMAQMKQLKGDLRPLDLNQENYTKI